MEILKILSWSIVFSMVLVLLSGCYDNGAPSADVVRCERELEKQIEQCADDAVAYRVHANEYMYKKISGLETVVKDKFELLNDKIEDYNLPGVYSDIGKIKEDVNLLYGIERKVEDINKNVIDLNDWLIDELD